MNRHVSASRVSLAVVGLVVIAQGVPYGHDHTNPPVQREAPWPDPRARAIAQHACYGCHSNETRWPWYSFIAPASWVVQHDVSEGREVLNFSEWDRPQKHARDIAQEVREGDMPPWLYRLGHAEARLSPSDESILLSAAAALGERP